MKTGPREKGQGRSEAEAAVDWRSSLRATGRGREVRTDYTQSLNNNTVMLIDLGFGPPASKCSRADIFFSV